VPIKKRPGVVSHLQIAKRFFWDADSRAWDRSPTRIRRMSTAPRFLLLFTIWVVACVRSGVAENIFPSRQFEVSLFATAYKPLEDEDPDETAHFREITTTWPTERDRTYVVQARVGDEEWFARCETFPGDGQPVDFVDIFDTEGPPVEYRIVSCRASDEQDVRISRINAGFLWDDGHLLSLVEFQVASEFVYEVETSLDAVVWKGMLKIDDEDIAIRIEDPAFREDIRMNYRVKVFQGPGKAEKNIPKANLPEPAKTASVRAGSASDRGINYEDAAAAKRNRDSLKNPPRIVRSIQFDVRKKKVSAGANYVTIDIAESGPNDDPHIALNNSNDVLYSKARADGLCDMFLWIAGTNYNLSEMTGVRFHRVLDIDDARAVVGSVMEDGKENVLGFRYEPQKEGPPKLKPLSAQELKDFKFEEMIPVLEGEIYINGRAYVAGKGKTLVPKDE
jgi:hypothetical protein